MTPLYALKLQQVTNVIAFSTITFQLNAIMPYVQCREKLDQFLVLQRFVVNFQLFCFEVSL